MQTTTVEISLNGKAFMDNIELFQYLVDNGYGHFVRLKTPLYSEDGDHKRPLDKDWLNRPLKKGRVIYENGYGLGFHPYSNCLVVDVDEPHPELQRWLEANRFPYGLTPRGGIHMLFLLEDGDPLPSIVGNKTGVWVEGVGKCDFRQNGQICISPDAGYRWVAYEPKLLPQRLKSFILNAVQGRHPNPPAPPSPNGNGNGNGKVSANSVFKAVEAFANGEIVGEGGRNEALLRLGLGLLSLYELLTDELPSPENWAKVAEYINSPEGFVSSREDKFASDYWRLLQMEIPNVPSLRRFVNAPKVAKALALMGYTASSINATIQAHSTTIVAEGQIPPPSTASAETFDLMTVSEILKRYRKGVRWAVDGVFSLGQLVLMSAQPSAGKSTFCRQLAVCLATGEPFLGIPTQPTKVLYLSNDESILTMGLHFEQLLKRLSAEQVEMVERRLRVATAQTRLEDFLYFVETQDLKNAVVIIDTIGKLLTDINSYDTTSWQMGALREICQRRNLAIVAVHHSPRSDHRALGSVALSGSADVEIILRNENGNRLLTIEKRVVKKLHNCPLRLEDGWLVLDGDRRIELVDILRRLFVQDGREFVFFDELPEELWEELGYLVEKRLVRLKTSEKTGKRYIKLLVPFPKLYKEVQMLQRELAELMKPLQEEYSDDDENEYDDELNDDGYGDDGEPDDDGYGDDDGEPDDPDGDDTPQPPVPDGTGGNGTVADGDDGLGRTGGQPQSLPSDSGEDTASATGRETANLEAIGQIYDYWRQRGYRMFLTDKIGRSDWEAYLRRLEWVRRFRTLLETIVALRCKWELDDIFATFRSPEDYCDWVDKHLEEDNPDRTVFEQIGYAIRRYAENGFPISFFPDTDEDFWAVFATFVKEYFADALDYLVQVHTPSDGGEPTANRGRPTGGGEDTAVSADEDGFSDGVGGGFSRNGSQPVVGRVGFSGDGCGDTMAMVADQSHLGGLDGVRPSVGQRRHLSDLQGGNGRPNISPPRRLIPSATAKAVGRPVKVHYYRNDGTVEETEW